MWTWDHWIFSEYIVLQIFSIQTCMERVKILHEKMWLNYHHTVESSVVSDYIKSHVPEWLKKPLTKALNSWSVKGTIRTWLVYLYFGVIDVLWHVVFTSPLSPCFNTHKKQTLNNLSWVLFFSDSALVFLYISHYTCRPTCTLQSYM